MAFITGKNIDFFGIMNGELLNLFSKNVSDFDSNPMLSVNDDFAVKLEQAPSENAKAKETNVQNIFTSAALSDCGYFITATDTNKNVFLWQKDNKWNPLSRRFLARKPYKVIFTHSTSEILVADRGGDIFSFSVSNVSEPGKLILGHISIILDLVMSTNDRFIITCDRDGKIRVSCYPNCYNIQSYCLGHNEFVSSLQLYSVAHEFLISSSGDETLKFWLYEEGKEIGSFPLECGLPNQSENDELLESNKKKKVVKVIKYCQELNIFVTVFYNALSVDIYQMDPTTVLKYVQTINFDDIVVDVCFTNENILLALLFSTPPSVCAFQCIDSKNIKFKKISDCKDPIFDLIQNINQKLSLFKLSLDFQLDFEYLYKQCFDFKCDDDNAGKCDNDDSGKINIKKKKSV